MARYVIKPGHVAFVDGAMREEGYEFVREKKYKKIPEHLAEVVSKPKPKSKAASGAKSGTAKASKATKAEAKGGVDFMGGEDETQALATSGRTVQL